MCARLETRTGRLASHRPARAVRAKCRLVGLTRPGPNNVRPCDRTLLTHAARAAAKQLNKLPGVAFSATPGGRARRALVRATAETNASDARHPPSCPNFLDLG